MGNNWAIVLLMILSDAIDIPHVKLRMHCQSPDEKGINVKNIKGVCVHPPGMI